MAAIRIKLKKGADGKAEKRFDLTEILAAVGERVVKSRWRCRDLWVLATFNDQPNSYRKRRLKISGAELLRMAAQIHQTIDGRFEARGEGAAKNPWLIIVAYDSSWFEVWSSKPPIIEQVKAHLQDYAEITEISGVLSEPVKHYESDSPTFLNV